MKNIYLTFKSCYAGRMKKVSIALTLVVAVICISLLIPSKQAAAWQTTVGGGVSSASQPMIVSPVTTDPCQSPAVAKLSALANITTATTTALVAVSGSTTVYVCGFTVQLNSTTASTVLLEQGTGAACASSPVALTPTFTNGTIASEPFAYGGAGQTIFKTAASNGLCAVSTVGTGPSIPVMVTYVQI